MTTIHQLNPPFHLWIPEAQDHGLALFLIDYHMEEHLYWVCAMEKTGEIWTLSNDKVRADQNRSIGRLYEKSHWRLANPDVAESLTWKAAYQDKLSADAKASKDCRYANSEPESRGTSNPGLSSSDGQPVPSPLRMREPKVHLDVPDASGDRKRKNPVAETFSEFRNPIAPRFIPELGAWWRTDNASIRSGKAKRRKGSHKAKHARRTKSKS